MNPLKAKTQRLKFEQQMKRIESAPVADSAVVPCDCHQWLLAHARKISPKKPKPMIAQPALVLVAPAAPKNLRNSAYNQRFEQGAAAWYHVPAVSLQEYNDAQINAIRYAALGTTVAGMGERSAKYLWRVLSVQLVPRHVLSVEQSGVLKASDEPYWLFELADARLLPEPIVGFGQIFSAEILPFSVFTAAA